MISLLDERKNKYVPLACTSPQVQYNPRQMHAYKKKEVSTCHSSEALFGTASTSSASLIRERSSEVASPIFLRAVQISTFCIVQTRV